MKIKIYECGICGAYHHWEWNGDCREKGCRIHSPEEYAEELGVSDLDIEVMSMDDRVEADCANEIEKQQKPY